VGRRHAPRFAAAVGDGDQRFSLPLGEHEDDLPGRHVVHLDPAAEGEGDKLPAVGAEGGEADHPFVAQLVQLAAGGQVLKDRRPVEGSCEQALSLVVFAALCLPLAAPGQEPIDLFSDAPPLAEGEAAAWKEV